jgi:thiosulfate dehydrogenase
MNDGRGMAAAMIASTAVGAIMIVATMLLGHPFVKGPASVANEDYGRRLMMRTTEYLGPEVPDVRMRFTASRLACASCHLDAGAEPGALSLIDSLERYPKITDRINECMTGNMNGRPLPADSEEVAAMISWLRFLADRNAATGENERAAHDPPMFQLPNRAANPAAGESIFEKRCADCHGTDGAGLPATRNPVQGYVFPPLWGQYSFNGSAEMDRIPIAAKFIKGKMPLGRPDLDDGQALDVAAYIAAKARPNK